MGNGRKTVYNSISSPEKLAKVNPENIQLGNDFLEYLTSIDRSKSTVDAYRNDLNIFWCWCLEFNQNKFFVDLSKREIAKYQNYCLNTLGWSPARMLLPLFIANESIHALSYCSFSTSLSNNSCN